MRTLIDQVLQEATMVEKFTVLVVDDSPENLSIISSILKNKYKVKVATSGAKALSIVNNSNQKPDLVLLDILMPEMDGYEVCNRLKTSAQTASVPVIFLTSLTREEDEEVGLKLGAVDYIHKPISPPILLARVQTHLKLKEAQDLLQAQNSILEQMVKHRTLELSQSRQATIVAMGTLAEYRDPETGNHLRRTQHYVKELAVELSRNPDYREYLTDERIEVLFNTAPLHDIGKVGIPDKVLFKPGKLTIEEYKTMKGHTIFGQNAISETQKLMDNACTFLMMSQQITAHHHERWDGSGYPEGLAGKAIPLSARLMAIADVYDALVSNRVYKAAFSHKRAVEIIKEESGTHFDPEIVKVFLKIANKFSEISDVFNDSKTP